MVLRRGDLLYYSVGFHGIYIYTLLEREERSIYAKSRNPRVCPAQNNVWCCAVERSVTLHGSHGSYSSQCGNVGCQALATAIYILNQRGDIYIK